MLKLMIISLIVFPLFFSTGCGDNGKINPVSGNGGGTVHDDENDLEQQDTDEDHYSESDDTATVNDMDESEDKDVCSDTDSVPDNGYDTDEDPCDSDPCGLMEGSAGQCVSTGNNYFCECENNYIWDENELDCIAVERESDCTNSKPENSSWSSSNPEGKITQVWDGTDWYPSADTCSWDCDPGYYTGKYYCSSIICTGQTKCYDDEKNIDCPDKGSEYFGQDSYYAGKGYCIPGGYDTDALTVVDKNTGLMWQRVLPEIYDGCEGGNPEGSLCIWENAVDYCENLEYDGYSDWRLPEIEEFETILHFGKDAPFIDETAFPNTPSGNYWTNTEYREPELIAWRINLSDGVTVNFSNKTVKQRVKCVRGDYYIKHGVFVEEEIGEDIVVTDLTTKLQWTTESLEKMKWEDALQYCEDLDYGGYIDWRLPNINELKTLLNRRLPNFPSEFPGITLFWFTSSTTNHELEERVWEISTYSGGIMGYSDKIHANKIFCIR
jgi:hypothetical protein